MEKPACSGCGEGFEEGDAVLFVQRGVFEFQDAHLAYVVGSGQVEVPRELRCVNPGSIGDWHDVCFEVRSVSQLLEGK